MRKSFNTTLILTGVCVVLLAWYLAYEKRWKVESKDAEEKAKQIVTLDKDQIHDVVIERMTNPPADGVTPPKDFKPQYEKVTLRKTGSDWNIAAPLQDSADNGTVNGMISTLVTTKQDRVIEEKPKDLVPFGLKDPVLRITVKKDTTAPAQEILVGANTPVGYNTYVKLGNSDAVYRVPRSLRTSFDKPLKDLRNKSVVPVSRNEISEVDITLPKQEIIVDKDETKDEWTLARSGIPADATEWTKTLSAVVDLKATDFPSMEGKTLKDYGLEKPAATITLVKGKDKTRTVVRLGHVKAKGSEKVYAKREDKDTVYEVDKDILSKVERPASDYRTKQLAKFDRFNIGRVKLERAKQTAGVELLKDQGTWTMPTDPKVKVDVTKVDSLLTKLQDIKIEKYLDKAPKLSDKATALVVRLIERKAPPAATGKDQKAPEPSETEKLTLKFSKPKANLVTVERSDINVPFEIKEADFKTIDLAKADFEQVEKKAAEAPKEAPAVKVDEKTSEKNKLVLPKKS